MNYQYFKLKKTIFFRVDGDNGSKVGLGHIYRTLKIYQFLKKEYSSKYNFVFLMKNYYHGVKIIKNITKEKIIIYNKEIFNFFFFKASDVIIIDTLGADSFFLKKIYSIGIKKVVSFDEINLGIFKNGLIINGIYYYKKKLKSKSNKLKIYQGPKYLILNKEFENKKKFNKFGRKKSVLICSGGADKKFFLTKVTKILLQIKGLYLLVIVGPGVEKNNPIFKIRKNNRIRLIKNSNNIKRYLDQVNFTFVTGGTVMFESICCGKITSVCKTYNHQRFAINYFKKKKLINYLGAYNNFKQDKIISFIKQQYYKEKVQKFLFNNLVKTVDGRGLARVKSIFKTFLK